MRNNNELKIGAPVNSIFEFNKSGWMTKDVFSVWFEHFIKFTNPSLSNRILLLLDGHSTHIKNIEIIYRAREVGIDIICFPPHTSHKLQPLDVSFMGPLKSNINKLLELHIKENAIVRLHDLVGIYSLATMNMDMVKLAISGFRKTGIYPFNDKSFSDEDFLPSATQEYHIDDIGEHVRLLLIKKNSTLIIQSPAIRITRSNNDIIVDIGN